MKYECIPRSHYEFMLEDGVIVERVKLAIRKAKGEQALYSPNEKKARQKIIHAVEAAMFRTSGEYQKLIRKKKQIKDVEKKYSE